MTKIRFGLYPQRRGFFLGFGFNWWRNPVAWVDKPYYQGFDLNYGIGWLRISWPRTITPELLASKRRAEANDLQAAYKPNKAKLKRLAHSIRKDMDGRPAADKEKET